VVYEGAKDVATLAYEKGKEIKETPQVQKLSSDAKEGLNKVSSKIKNILGVEHPQQNPHENSEELHEPLVQNPSNQFAADASVVVPPNNVQVQRYPDQI